MLDWAQIADTFFQKHGAVGDRLCLVDGLEGGL